MPARLLAYGGTSFSERRKIGPWPAVPEATLRDTYGLTATTWCFGVGTLGKQPFVILRQRQNIENRGGYPFSLLFDPGEEAWLRFGYNAAALAAAILNTDDSVRELLLQTPERCSAEALERVAAELLPRRGPANGAGENLQLLCLASCVSPEPVVASASSLGLHEKLDPERMAGLLEILPPCYRLATGWLVGGGAAHGRALGANLVIDEQAAVDQDRLQQHIETGRRYWQAWEFPANRPLAAPLESKPVWTWDVEPARYLDGLVLLQDVLTAIDPGEGLFERVEQKQESTAALDNQIEQAATALLTRGSGPLGPKASQWMLALSLRDKRKVDAKTAGRLDRKVVFDELRRFGIPPKAVPRQLQIARDVRVGLWLDYLDRLRGDVRKNLESALDQLGPDLTQEEREQLAHAALLALPASDEKLIDWDRFRKDPDLWTMLQPVLRDEALVRFRRHDRTAAEAYLAMGEDPGGIEARTLLPQKEDFARLVDEIRAMRKNRPELVDAWLAPFPKPAEPPAASVVPERMPRRRERTDDLGAALESVLFRSRPDSVERRTQELHNTFQNAAVTDLEAVIVENCRESGSKFAAAFAGKYMPLGDVMGLLSEAAQDRLIECFAENLGGKFAQRAAIDIAYALNNPASRNAYSRALSRYLVNHPDVRKTVAQRRSEESRDLDRKLKSMLAKRKARA